MYPESNAGARLEAQAEETLAERLAGARKSVIFALRAIGEGQLDTDVCDAERALAGALREMEQLQITLAVMEKQHEM